jgi:hypothetical protein
MVSVLSWVDQVLQNGKIFGGLNETIQSNGHIGKCIGHVERERARKVISDLEAANQTAFVVVEILVTDR